MMNTNLNQDKKDGRWANFKLFVTISEIVDDFVGSMNSFVSLMRKAADSWTKIGARLMTGATSIPYTSLELWTHIHIIGSHEGMFLRMTFQMHGSHYNYLVCAMWYHAIVRSHRQSKNTVTKHRTNKSFGSRHKPRLNREPREHVVSSHFFKWKDREKAISLRHQSRHPEIRERSKHNHDNTDEWHRLINDVCEMWICVRRWTRAAARHGQIPSGCDALSD